MGGSGPGYTQEEVNEILRRALAQEASRESVLSHSELVEIANEVGIDRSSLDQAIADLAQERVRDSDRKDEAAEISAERKVQLKRFCASLTSHLALNVFVYLVSTRLLGGAFWVWVLLASGAVMALKLRHVLFPYERVLRRRKRERRQREREQRAAVRAEWGRRLVGAGGQAGVASSFESVVQKGVQVLLAVAERKLEEHRSRAREDGRPSGR